MPENSTTALSRLPDLQAFEYLQFEPADLPPAQALSNFAFGTQAAGLSTFSKDIEPATTISGYRNGRRLLGTIKFIGIDDLNVIQAAPAPGHPANTPTAIRAVANTNAKVDAIMLVSTRIEIPQGVKDTDLVQTICGTWMEAAAAQLERPPALRRFKPVPDLFADSSGRRIAQIRTVSAGASLMLVATAPLAPGNPATIIARRFHRSDEEFFQD